MALCTICHHPRREDIDAALLDGGADAAVSRAFAVSRLAIRRHRINHLRNTPHDTPAAFRRDLRRFIDSTNELFLRARDKDPVAALRASNHVERLFQLRWKFMHLPAEDEPVSSHQLERFQSRLAETLSPFPEAKQAVARLIAEELGIPDDELLIEVSGLDPGSEPGPSN
ncbi:MAG: hypothetical protein ACKV22_04370 [Bryobacteraceae bacterium]